MTSIFLLALVVGTWNGNWFPSGRAEHRASPAKEERTVELAAEMLSDGLDRVDPSGKDDVVICLNEMRNAAVVSNLLSKMRRKDLRLAVITRYRRRDRFDQQQDAIITSMPAVESRWAVFRKTSDYSSNPPRGYAYSAVISDGGSVTTGVYAVHLKSEYGATRESIRASNRKKRASAAKQIVAMEKPRGRGKKKSPPSRVIVAGDINADKWNPYFAKDSVFSVFEDAGFDNVFRGMEAEDRDTRHTSRWGASTIDYILPRLPEKVRRVHIEKTNGASDHNAVFAVF